MPGWGCLYKAVIGSFKEYGVSYGPSWLGLAEWRKEVPITLLVTYTYDRCVSSSPATR